jgi:hypothetical protein
MAMHTGVRIGDGRALLRQERHSGEWVLPVVAGMGIAVLAAIAIANGDQISSWLMHQKYLDCLGVEASRFPFDTEALSAYCRALITR